MKSSLLALPTLLVSVWFSCLNAQEVATKWDVEIPGPITDGTPSEPAPKPEPIEFTVLSSRTTRLDVKEAPEMPDLPSITGTINVTVQLVEDPNLPDPPPPLPALPPDDPAVVARLAEISVMPHCGLGWVFHRILSPTRPMRKSSRFSVERFRQDSTFCKAGSSSTPTIS